MFISRSRIVGGLEPLETEWVRPVLFEWCGTAELAPPPTKMLPTMQAVLDGAVLGDVYRIRSNWSASTANLFSGLSADEVDHPLLHAVHRAQPDAVDALCELGMSPLQPGTLRPYTGDGFSVSDLKRITPLELAERMLVQCSRRSKRRSALLAIRDSLESTFQRQQAEQLARIEQEVVDHATPLKAGIPATTPSTAQASATKSDIVEPSPAPSSLAHKFEQAGMVDDDDMVPEDGTSAGGAASASSGSASARRRRSRRVAELADRPGEGGDGTPLVVRNSKRPLSEAFEEMAEPEDEPAPTTTATDAMSDSEQPSAEPEPRPKPRSSPKPKRVRQSSPPPLPSQAPVPVPVPVVQPQAVVSEPAVSWDADAAASDAALRQQHLLLSATAPALASVHTAKTLLGTEIATATQRLTSVGRGFLRNPVTAMWVSTSSPPRAVISASHRSQTPLLWVQRPDVPSSIGPVTIAARAVASSLVLQDPACLARSAEAAMASQGTVACPVTHSVDVAEALRLLRAFNSHWVGCGSPPSGSSSTARSTQQGAASAAVASTVAAAAATLEAAAGLPSRGALDDIVRTFGWAVDCADSDSSEEALEALENRRANVLKAVQASSDLAPRVTSLGKRTSDKSNKSSLLSAAAAMLPTGPGDLWGFEGDGAVVESFRLPPVPEQTIGQVTTSDTQRAALEAPRAILRGLFPLRASVLSVPDETTGSALVLVQSALMHSRACALSGYESALAAADTKTAPQVVSAVLHRVSEGLRSANETGRPVDPSFVARQGVNATALPVPSSIDGVGAVELAVFSAAQAGEPSIVTVGLPPMTAWRVTSAWASGCTSKAAERAAQCPLASTPISLAGGGSASGLRQFSGISQLVIDCSRGTQQGSGALLSSVLVCRSPAAATSERLVDSLGSSLQFFRTTLSTIAPSPSGCLAALMIEVDGTPVGSPDILQAAATLIGSAPATDAVASTAQRATSKALLDRAQLIRRSTSSVQEWHSAFASLARSMPALVAADSKSYRVELLPHSSVAEKFARCSAMSDSRSGPAVVLSSCPSTSPFSEAMGVAKWSSSSGDAPFALCSMSSKPLSPAVQCLVAWFRVERIE
jgi:hypothetical protein